MVYHIHRDGASDTHTFIRVRTRLWSEAIELHDGLAVCECAPDDVELHIGKQWRFCAQREWHGGEWRMNKETERETARAREMETVREQFSAHHG